MGASERTRVRSQSMSAPQTYETLIVEDGTGEDEGITTITLNRPSKKNAMNEQMWDEMLVVLRQLSDGLAARVVVITGAGGDFCSGADLSGPV